MAQPRKKGTQFHETTKIDGTFRMDEDLTSKDLTPSLEGHPIFANEAFPTHSVDGSEEAKSVFIAEPAGGKENFGAILLQLLDKVVAKPEAIVAVIDTEFRLIFFNTAYQTEVRRHTGHELLPGMKIAEVYASKPELWKASTSGWQQALDGQTFTKVRTFGDPSRYSKIYQSRYFPLKDSSGTIIGAGLISKDVTDEFYANQEKVEREERYNGLFNIMTEGFTVGELIFDKQKSHVIDFRFLDANPAFEKFTSCSRSELIDRTYSEVFSAEGNFPMEELTLLSKTSLPRHFQVHFSASNQDFDVFSYPINSHRFYSLITNITEKRKAEQTQEWLASFPQYNPHFVLEIDLAGNLTYENPASKARFVGPKTEDFRHPMLQGIHVILEIIKRGEKTQIQREIHFGKAWYRQAIQYLPDMQRVRIYSLDISDRVAAEEALREINSNLEATIEWRTDQIRQVNEALKHDIEQRELAEQALLREKNRLNDILEFLPAYVVYLTPDNKISFVNRYFRERFGDIPGPQQEKFSVDVEQFMKQRDIRAVLESLQPQHWEWKGPDSRIYAVHDIPLRNTEGELFILEIGMDITEIRQAQEDLKLSNAYNRNLIEVDLDTLVTITSDGKIGDVNTATEKITGLSREEMIGTDFHSYFTDPEKAMAGYQKAFEDGFVRDYELEIRHKNGHVTPVVYNASVYYDPNGNVDGVFAGARDLTELKRSEAELKLLDTALRAAANGILITDGTGKVIWSNPAISYITGYSFDELQSESSVNKGLGLGDHLLAEVIMKAAEGKRVLHREVISTRKDRTAHIQQQTVTPIFDNRGNIINFIIVVEDITERKQVEQHLAQSEERYRTLFENSQNPIFLLDSEKTIILANQQAALSHGFNTSQELQDLKIEELVLAEDRTILDQNIQLAFRQGMIKDIECQFIRQDGTKFPGLMAVSVLKDAEGKELGFLVEVTDITKRKEAENFLQQNARRNQMLAETSLAIEEVNPDEQATMDQVAEKCSSAFGGLCLIHMVSADQSSMECTSLSSPDPVFTKNISEGVKQTRLSMEAGLVSGVYREGKPVIINEENFRQFAKSIPPSILSILEKNKYKNIIIVPILSLGKPIGTISVLHPSGGYPYTEDDLGMLELLADRLGLALRNAHLYQDLRQSLENEQAMRNQVVQSEKFVAMGRLLGSITHELNNPLQTIKNCLYLVQNKLPDDSLALEFLHIASSETERISNLVAQLREMYRPRQISKFVPVSMNELVSDVRELMISNMQDMKVEWMGGPNESKLPVLVVGGIPDQLKQVLINILTNGIEAMQPDGGKLLMELIPPTNNKEIGVRIKDTGPGISSDNLSKMFEPFFSTKTKGLGLGLSICYDIVQRHGGRITVQSKPGEGATFEIWLPELAGQGIEGR